MPQSTHYLKNAFWILLILNFAGPILKSLQKQYDDYLTPKNKIGVVYVSGLITSSARINKQLDRFFKDREIKAILLKIESPGGAAGTAQAISHEIMDLKRIHPKPVIAYSENLCASGAYHIAAAADHIVTTGSCLVGNIGARLSTIFKAKDFLETYKVQTHSVAAGDYKTALDPLADYTPDQQAMLQHAVDESYQQFATDVAKYRHIPISQKDQWANGKVFAGSEALQLKLIDEIGNQTTALNQIKKMILHSDRELELIKATQPSRWHKLWHGDSDDDSGIETSLASSIGHEIYNRLYSSGISF